MSEAIRVQCGGCRSTIKAPAKYQGKRVKCPKCGEGLTIPRAEVVEEPVFLDDDAFEDDDGFLSGDLDDYGRNEEYDEFDQAFGHRPAPPARRSRSAAGSMKKKSGRRSSAAASSGGLFNVNGGVIGGVLMMVIAVVWFVVGLRGDVIFFYPPVMFIIGLVAFFKGLTGSD